MNLIHNARMTLFAEALSNLSVATFAAGIIAPLIGVLYGTGPAAAHGWWFMIGVVWLLTGGGLHVLAHIVLGRLRP